MIDFTPHLPYAGICLPDTPEAIQLRMTKIAVRLAANKFVLRSGGTDTAFELGCPPLLHEIYLPWARFNNKVSQFSFPTAAALELASEHHPTWDTLSLGARKLHARIAHQLLGYGLNSPASFLVCWTDDGCESPTTRSPATGPAGQAISIAASHNIPVFNLKTADAIDRLTRAVKSLRAENTATGHSPNRLNISSAR